MWKLLKFVEGKDVVEEGLFDSVGAAAARIVAIEGYPTTGTFLEVHATPHATDEEAFSFMDHKGKKASYIVRRHVQ